MKKKSTVALVSIALLSVGILSACGTSKTESKKVETSQVERTTNALKKTVRKAIDKAYLSRNADDIKKAETAIKKLEVKNQKTYQVELDKLKTLLEQLKTTDGLIATAEKSKKDVDVTKAQNAINAEKDSYLEKDKKSQQARLDKVKQAISAQKVKAETDKKKAEATKSSASNQTNESTTAQNQSSNAISNNNQSSNNGSTSYNPGQSTNTGGGNTTNNPPSNNSNTGGNTQQPTSPVTPPSSSQTPPPAPVYKYKGWVSVDGVVVYQQIFDTASEAGAWAQKMFNSPDIIQAGFDGKRCNFGTTPVQVN